MRPALPLPPREGCPPAAATLVAALLAGCVAGPDYRRPEPPAAQDYASAPLPVSTASAPVIGGDVQRLAVARDVQGDWWTLMRSPQLDALIARAFDASPTIQAAHAALRVAQENVEAQRGAFFPTVQASYSPSRTKTAGNPGGNGPGAQGDGPAVYNLHTAQLTVGFAPDLLGGNRRQVEAARAQADAQSFQLAAGYVTLATNIVAAAIQDASLRQQIAIVGELVDGGTAAVEMSYRQLKSGYGSRLDVALQESALAQVRQLLPPLQKQFEQNRDLLRTLAGDSQDKEVPAFVLDEMQLPPELPLSLPSQLVEQRPDVRAAEAQLRTASAQVGIARAARLPQFSIDATAGGAAGQFGQMLWQGGRFFNLAATITQPLLDGGALEHREQAARESLKQAAALYQATVITAFQNVADALQAIHGDARALRAASDALDAARTTLDLTRRQHGRGYLDRLALIGAEQTYRQAQLSLVQARAARLTDSAVLFQALGGGWWHRSAMQGASPAE